MSQPTFGVITITPEWAAGKLTTSENIRKLRKHRVELYAEKLKQNMFTLSNDAICVSPNGTLLNGFHRLQACLETGISFDALVGYDVPDESVHAMDQGLKRTTADFLSLPDGNETGIAAMIKMILAWDMGILHNTTAVSKNIFTEHVQEFAEENYEALTDAYRIGRSIYKTIGGNPSAWTSFVYKINLINPMLAEEFISAIKTGAGLSVGDSRLAVRNWFARQQIDSRRKRSQISPLNTLHIAVQGWNCFLKGQKRQSFSLPRKDSKTMALPELMLPQAMQA